MKRCPRCDCTQAWLLGDGRSKCQSCNLRYSWKSVWEAIRLPEAEKQVLLRSFVGEAGASSDLASSGVISPGRRQRFYRLARACCTLESPVPYEALYVRDCRPPPSARRTSMRGWATAHQVMILTIVEYAGTVRICLPPVSPTHVLGLLRERSALGGVLRILDNLAYASLPVLGEYVTLPRVTQGALAMQSVEAFWHYARIRLQSVRRIPLRHFPQHLAELCFRFNRRQEDLLMQVSDLLQATAMSDVRSSLNALHERERARSALLPAPSVESGAHIYE